MHEPEPPTPGRPQLSDWQLSRLDYARRDLESIRSQDLEEVPPSGLVLMVATLTRRLEDSLAIHTEVCGPLPHGPAGPVEQHP
ncbi:hypothetical protein ACFYRN_29010 [Streptomyces sp. NPDC005227]|uniref:hypothetical protein n=1 Tax=Streptomyces sp. NPDC005227 TaxID=3364707 RepID=UPI003680C47B